MTPQQAATRHAIERAAAQLVVIGFLLATTWIYEPVLRAGYVFDDVRVLPQIGDWIWWPLDRYLWSALSFRVTANASLQHTINLLLHLLNGGLLYFVLDRWKAPLVVTALAPAIFLVHPLQAETVAYVSGGRPDLLITLGVLLALHGIADLPSTRDWWRYAWTSPQRRGWALAQVCAGAALIAGAKPSGVLVYPILYLAAVQGRVRVPRRLRWGLVCVAIAVIVNYASLRGSVSLGGWTWQAHAALQLAAVHQWLVQVILPLGLTVDPNVGAWGPAWLIEVRVVALAVVGVGAWRISVPARWLIGWLTLTLGWRIVLPSTEWLSEGDGYLALAGVAVLIAYGVQVLVEKGATWR